MLELVDNPQAFSEKVKPINYSSVSTSSTAISFDKKMESSSEDTEEEYKAKKQKIKKGNHVNFSDDTALKEIITFNPADPPSAISPTTIRFPKNLRTRGKKY